MVSVWYRSSEDIIIDYCQFAAANPSQKKMTRKSPQTLVLGAAICCIVCPKGGVEQTPLGYVSNHTDASGHKFDTRLKRYMYYLVT